MSSNSEVCLVCLGLLRTGEGLLLRLTEVEDIAKEGIFRKCALADVVRPRGDPIDTCGDNGAVSDEYRARAYSNDELFDVTPSDRRSSSVGGLISW